MRYNYYFIILCFVGVMQSKKVYFYNDYAKAVQIRLIHDKSEIFMAAQCTQTLEDGQKVCCNRLQKNLVYLAHFDDVQKNQNIVVQMIISGNNDSPARVFSKSLDVGKYKKDYIRLSALFGADVTCRL